MTTIILLCYIVHVGDSLLSSNDGSFLARFFRFELACLCRALAVFCVEYRLSAKPARPPVTLANIPLFRASHVKHHRTI